MSRRRNRASQQAYGYRGRVTLVSPAGEKVTLQLPGRERLADWERELRSVPRDCVWSPVYISEHVLRQQRRFYRLLTAGWKVVNNHQPIDEVAPVKAVQPEQFSSEPEQKESEGVEEVAEATEMMSSEDVHGGNEATKDIASSPNAADNGQYPDNEGAEDGQEGDQGEGEGDVSLQPSSRGSQDGGKNGSGESQKGQGDGNETGNIKNASQSRNDSGTDIRYASRGSRSPRRKAERARERQVAQRKSQAQPALTQMGSTGIFCLTPVWTSPAMRQSAAKSARLLAELVGRSSQKTIQGTEVNAFDLLVALETGDNPLPALERPRLRPRLRVLITPDCSGSTQDWSGLGQAWALEIANLPDDVDVTFAYNMNGQFMNADGRMVLDSAVDTMLRDADIVIYLGDGDGYKLCHDYAAKGATVVALDCYCASVASARLKEVNRRGSGCVYWVDKVSVHEPSTWHDALKLVLEHQLT